MAILRLRTEVADERGRWLVVERRSPAFSASEVARVAALLRLSNAGADDAQALEKTALVRIGPPRAASRRRGSFRRAATDSRAAT